MAKYVIDPFQVIEVAHDQRNRPVLIPACPHLYHGLPKSHPVLNSGKSIPVTLLPQGLCLEDFIRHILNNAPDWAA